MEHAWAALRKGNPLRTDISWQPVLVEGILAIGAAGTALVLVVWGCLLRYQAWQNSSSSRVLGWAAIIVGLALIVIACLRRTRGMHTA